MMLTAVFLNLSSELIKRRFSAITLILLFSANLPRLANADSVLTGEVTVRLGLRAIEVKKGTPVRILKSTESSDVVMLTLPDGSPFIAQISSALISGHQRPETQDSASTLVPSDAPVDSSTEPNRPTAPVSEVRPKNEINLSSVDGWLNAPQVYPQFKLPSISSSEVLPPPRYTALHGSFTLSIDNADFTVVYALPMEGDRLAKSANNLVFYGPYPGEKTKLTGNIIPALVTNLGCTVFSFQFEGLGQLVSDTPYWFKEAGWFDAALQARDLIDKSYGFECKKLILYGFSGGGGMVMNFAGACPDDVEAVAAQAPNVVPAYPAGNKVKWLMVVNRGDTNRFVMRPFYERLQKEKCTALYCETTPDRNRGHYHAPSSQTFDLIYSFIAGILEQRELAARGVDELPRLWPYAAPVAPLQRCAIAKTSDLSVEDLSSGMFDLLPSLTFAAKWCRVCPPEQDVVPAGTRVKLTLNFPALPIPGGIVLYYDTPSCGDIPREIEDINSLAEHGYLVISTMTASPENFVSAAASWIKSQDKLQGLHIHLVGNSLPGARFISDVAGRHDIGFKSVSLIDFTDSRYDSQCIENVTSAAKECGMYGFFAYSASGSASGLSDLANTLVDRGAQHRGCFNLTVKPEPSLRTSEVIQHLEAENQALAMVKSLINRADSP